MFLEYFVVQLHHFHSGNAQAFFLETADNFSYQRPLYGARLEQYQRSLHAFAVSLSNLFLRRSTPFRWQRYAKSATWPNLLLFLTENDCRLPLSGIGRWRWNCCVQEYFSRVRKYFSDTREKIFRKAALSVQYPIREVSTAFFLRSLKFPMRHTAESEPLEYSIQTRIA